MGFFNNLNEKIQSFMVGRNGSDRLGRWALGGAVVLMAIDMFIPNVVLMAASYALLFYSVYRMFSTNVSARASENARFEELLDKLPFGKGGSKGGGKGAGQGGSRWGQGGTGTGAGKASWGKGGSKGNGANGHGRTKPGSARGNKQGATQAKLHIVCEKCGQSLSVPAGRGTLKVTCPKCSHQMKVKS